MNTIEKLKEEILKSTGCLERVLKSLDSIKDDEEGSVTLELAYRNIAIQKK